MSQAVLGGGISGMAAAFYLSKSAVKNVSVYESSNRWGGWIKSVKSSSGALFELGPRLLRHGVESSPQNALQLVKELELMPMTKPLLLSNKELDIKMLYLNDKLIRVPSGFSSLFKGHKPFIQPLIFGIMKDLRTPKKDLQDESIHDFVARRFGEDYAEILIGSLVCGIFAGDAKEISVRAIWKTLFDLEQKHGGVIRGLLSSWRSKAKELKASNPMNLNWSLWSFKDGLETLPTRLSEYLKSMDVGLFLENKCSRLRFQKGEAILTINGEENKFSHVYSSLPSKELAKILGYEHSFLKTELSSIPFVSVGVVNLEYAGNALKERGFGCLVPPNQNLPVLGITFDTRIFPQEGKTVLTVMMGGKWFEQHFGDNPDEETLLQTALEYVKRILKIEEKPVNSLVTIAKDCLPQYVVGHSVKVEKIRKYIKGRKLPLTLIGASFDGVSVTDAILSARKGVESALKQ